MKLNTQTMLTKNILFKDIKHCLQIGQFSQSAMKFKKKFLTEN